MSLRASGVLCALLNLLSFNASAVMLDFESLEHDDLLQVNHGNSYTEKGFNISGVNLFSNGTQRQDYHGSTALFFGLQGVDGTLTASGGHAFNLVSINLVEVNSWSPTDKVTFTGYLQGVEVASQDFTLDNVFAMGSGFQTFSFNGFENVTSVVWQNSNPFHQFDNIVVTPVPAAAWLFASGLLGLLGMTRRRRSA